MTWISIISIAVALGMDAFAVAISAGSQFPQVTPRRLFRLSFHFGLFQFMMPIIGFWAGSTISDYIKDYDHWVALGLLCIVGGKMIKESLADDDCDKKPPDPTKGWTLVVLSVATSIDALAVGLSMAFLGVAVWMPSVIIGVVALMMTAVGMFFGSRLGMLFGRRAGLIGGLILIGIGVKILIEHTM
jgi:putative Mn2+ efflux pump MntP